MPIHTEADTLVEQYPTRKAQLEGPVLFYLRTFMPFNGTDQDLFMSVFYPIYRKLSPDTVFNPRVQAANPGIKIVNDYVTRVNKVKGPSLLPEEDAALVALAQHLGVYRDSLYRLIAFESSWDAAARNKITGARGLIQFMPSTAKWMGFKA